MAPWPPHRMGGLSFSMELLEGRTLKDVVLGLGPLPVAEAVRVVRRSLEGLSAAHESGIIHRDFKPQNVFLCSSGEVKLLDFGFARVASAAGLTTRSLVLCTPDYAAPEVIAGRVADGRADLCAVGATLYEALTGRLPFRGATPFEVLRQHMEGSAPRPAAGYTYLAMPPRMADSSALGISNAGVVSGWAQASGSGVSEAVVWQVGKYRVLETMPYGAIHGGALVNNNGTVVWGAADGGVHAFEASTGGAVTGVACPPGVCTVTAISDQGRVAGTVVNGGRTRAWSSFKGVVVYHDALVDGGWLTPVGIDTCGDIAAQLNLSGVGAAGGYLLGRTLVTQCDDYTVPVALP